MQKKFLLPSILVGVALITAAFVILQKPIGTEEWRAIQDRIYPQFTRVSTKQVLPLVYHEFTKDLDVGYVLDKENAYDFLMQEDLARWSVTAEQVREIAMENLEDLAKNTKLEVSTVGKSKKEKYVTIETTDGYSAVRILSPSFRERIATELGSPFAAAFPVRDFLIAWPSEFSIGYQFVEQVEKEYAAGGAYKFTAKVHKVTADAITQLP